MQVKTATEKVSVLLTVRLEDTTTQMNAVKLARVIVRTEGPEVELSTDDALKLLHRLGAIVGLAVGFERGEITIDQINEALPR